MNGSPVSGTRLMRAASLALVALLPACTDAGDWLTPPPRHQTRDN